MKLSDLLADQLKKVKIEVISITKEIDVLERITSTAELAFTLTLSAVRNLIPAIESVKHMEWDYEKFIGRQLNYLKIFQHICIFEFQLIILQYLNIPRKTYYLLKLPFYNFEKLLNIFFSLNKPILIY